MRVTQQLLEKVKGSILAKVEPSFCVIKRKFSLNKTRYRGMANKMTSSNYLCLAEPQHVQAQTCELRE